MADREVTSDELGLVLRSARLVLERPPATDAEREAHAVVRALRVVLLEFLEEARFHYRFAARARDEAHALQVALEGERSVSELLGVLLEAEKKARG